MHAHHPHPHHAITIDPHLDRALRRLVMIGLAAVLLLPVARGSSAWLGWMPLWLLGMPLAGWWALHRFHLPHWPKAQAEPACRRRQGRAQARRRGPQGLPRRFAHAA